MDSTSSAIWINSDDEGDDCVVLDHDPDGRVSWVDANMDQDEDLLVVGEKGHCHCYACDAPAPCSFWHYHCHATDKDEKWKGLRKFIKQSSIPPLPSIQQQPDSTVQASHFGPSHIAPQSVFLHGSIQDQSYPTTSSGTSNITNHASVNQNHSNSNQNARNGINTQQRYSSMLIQRTLRETDQHVREEDRAQELYPQMGNPDSRFIRRAPSPIVMIDTNRHVFVRGTSIQEARNNIDTNTQQRYSSRLIRRMLTEADQEAREEDRAEMLDPFLDPQEGNPDPRFKRRALSPIVVMNVNQSGHVFRRDYQQFIPAFNMDWKQWHDLVAGPASETDTFGSCYQLNKFSFSDFLQLRSACSQLSDNSLPQTRTNGDAHWFDNSLLAGENPNPFDINGDGWSYTETGAPATSLSFESIMAEFD